MNYVHEELSKCSVSCAAEKQASDLEAQLRHGQEELSQQRAAATAATQQLLHEQQALKLKMTAAGQEQERLSLRSSQLESESSELEALRSEIAARASELKKSEDDIAIRAAALDSRACELARGAAQISVVLCPLHSPVLLPAMTCQARHCWCARLVLPAAAASLAQAGPVSAVLGCQQVSFLSCFGHSSPVPAARAGPNKHDVPVCLLHKPCPATASTGHRQTWGACTTTCHGLQLALAGEDCLKKATVDLDSRQQKQRAQLKEQQQALSADGQRLAEALQTAASLKKDAQQSQERLTQWDLELQAQAAQLKALNLALEQRKSGLETKEAELRAGRAEAADAAQPVANREASAKKAEEEWEKKSAELQHMSRKLQSGTRPCWAWRWKARIVALLQLSGPSILSTQH